MKKIIFFILGYFLFLKQTSAGFFDFIGGFLGFILGGGNGGTNNTGEYSSLRGYIVPENLVVINNNSSKPLLFSILEYLRNSIFGVLALIAIGVFIYIGFKILLARGNPEEFKKAIMHFVYAIIGLVIIALSWGMVRMISSLTL